MVMSTLRGGSYTWHIQDKKEREIQLWSKGNSGFSVGIFLKL